MIGHIDSVANQCDDIVLFCCLNVEVIKGSFPEYLSRCAFVSHSVLTALWGDPARFSDKILNTKMIGIS